MLLPSPLYAPLCCLRYLLLPALVLVGVLLLLALSHSLLVAGLFALDFSCPFYAQRERDGTKRSNEEKAKQSWAKATTKQNAKAKTPFLLLLLLLPC